MKVCAFGLALMALWVATPVEADESLPRLKVGSEVYSNVTVTEVTTTDIYFNHARGIGSAKLKDLSPDLQKHFNFDAAKASELTKQQHEANERFRQDFIARSTKAAAAEISDGRIRAVVNEDGDLVVTKLYAKSVRGERPPQIYVPEWITPPPNIEGKFVLLVFWATWAEQCRNGVPHLNALHEKFKDRVVIIALSDESIADMSKAPPMGIRYSLGTDVQAHTRNALEVIGLPHSILIDPKGIVRFEGTPDVLDQQGLARVIEKYSE